MLMNTRGQGRNSIFISYSHKDAKHLERLRTHLVPLIRAGLDVWDDTRIEGGQLWREEIADALASARVAILLVSADFLASEFITENELPPLLAAASSGGTTIVTVVVGFCNFSKSPLSQYQAMNEPSKPLNNLKPSQREEVWAHMAARVERLMLAESAGQEISEEVNTAPDPFWTPQLIRKLEDDLDALTMAVSVPDDIVWLRERLRETREDEKARMLTIWDSISELETAAINGVDESVNAPLIGYLHDWRIWHDG